MQTRFEFAKNRAGEVARMVENAIAMGHTPNPADLPMITHRYIFDVYNALDVRKAILNSADGYDNDRRG